MGPNISKIIVRWHESQLVQRLKSPEDEKGAKLLVTDLSRDNAERRQELVTLARQKLR
jgi:hypothetical protein